MFRSTPCLTLAAARSLVDAALACADRDGVPVSVAVTDPSGSVIASARMDDAPLGSYRLAGDKAYTSALWAMPSGDLHDSSQPGGADWGVSTTEGGRIVVYAGGFPVLRDGVLAGALGVSGGTGDQDEAIAVAALHATGLG